ncbi:hypothetical protein Pfo_022308 [Paulownia fortunei]|nr:hypothetical protein Pfo_022308 [Paulownia fortunei]
MGFSTRAFPLHLPILISSLLIQTAISVNPLFSICSSSQNFTANSPYERNLNKLLGDLYFKTPPTGFGLGSSGQYPDRAYGISLCRGDVSTKDCEACFVEASNEITKRCPNDRGAIIWYDNCYLKYLDGDFLGKIDSQNKFYIKLSENACETTRMHANGDVEIGGYEKIYAMVQCSRDLSRVDCKKCLDDAVSELPGCCGGKEGGRVVGGSTLTIISKSISVFSCCHLALVAF